jgi:hypothetical protein
VKNGDTVLGYVASDPNYWTPLLSPDAGSALRISFDASVAATSVSSVAFTQLNDGRGTYFGLVAGRDNANSDIAPGLFQYVLLTGLYKVTKRLISIQLSLSGSRSCSRQ